MQLIKCHIISVIGIKPNAELMKKCEPNQSTLQTPPVVTNLPGICVKVNRAEIAAYDLSLCILNMNGQHIIFCRIYL